MPTAHPDLGDACDFSTREAGGLLAVGADQGLEILYHGEEIEADRLVTGAGNLGAELNERRGVGEGLLESLGTVSEESLGGHLEPGELFSRLSNLNHGVLGDEVVLEELLQSLLQLGDVVAVGQVPHLEDLLECQLVEGGRLVVDVVGQEPE